MKTLLMLITVGLALSLSGCSQATLDTMHQALEPEHFELMQLEKELNKEVAEGRMPAFEAAQIRREWGHKLRLEKMHRERLEAEKQQRYYPQPSRSLHCRADFVGGMICD